MNKMRIRPNLKLLQVIFVLFLAGLACNMGSAPEVIPTSAPPTQVPQPTSAPEQPQATPTNQDQPASAGLSGNERQHLASATVLIYMAFIENGQISPFGIGSGTILSPDGIILTNAHVAMPSAGGFGDDPDVLVVALNENESSPPVARYLAEVQAVDGELDLAVIRITSNLDGSFLSTNSLNLPFVDIGNSDEMHLGDNIYIFGFPGIGGETITFTRGSVSGFTTENPVGDRAWIKTDATIAGGNSGGLGANDLGQIIGIPTRGGSGGNVDIADCRVVQDTNGDGRMDQNDTCIPIGGFINALRPINLALPLVRAAQTGTAYVSPYGSPGGGGIAGTGSESLGFVSWSKYYDDQTGCGLETASNFPAGIDQLTAVFNFNGMTDGQDFALYWLIDGENIVNDFFPWEYGSSGNCFPFFIHNGGDALPNGRYTLLLFTGEGMPQVAEVSTNVGGTGGGGPAGGKVSVDGFVYDADSGNPIADAVVVILLPGLDPDQWLDNGSDSDVLTWASTDSNGYFKLPVSLDRGIDYPALAGASSKGYLTTTGFLFFEEADPDLITLEIELNK